MKVKISVYLTGDLVCPLHALVCASSNSDLADIPPAAGVEERRSEDLPNYYLLMRQDMSFDHSYPRYALPLIPALPWIHESQTAKANNE